MQCFLHRRLVLEAASKVMLCESLVLAVLLGTKG